MGEWAGSLEISEEGKIKEGLPQPGPGTGWDLAAKNQYTLLHPSGLVLEVPGGGEDFGVGSRDRIFLSRKTSVSLAS